MAFDDFDGIEMYNDYLTERQRQKYVVDGLKMNRTTHEPVWREIANSYLPYRLRLQLSDSNRGDRRNQNLYDSTIIRCVKTFESGFMTAATDPTSEWFSMTSPTPDFVEFGPHKQWFADATQIMLSKIDDSNTYVSLPTIYGNCAGFGFGALSIEESFRGKAPFHTRVIPTGQGWYGLDDMGNVCAFYEEIRYTVWQLYERFGKDATFSGQVQNMIDKGHWEDWVDVGHLIQPNRQYKPDSPLSSEMAYRSCWFETGESSRAHQYLGRSSADERYLEEGGFHEFPIVVFPWERTEGDVYPNDYPGVESLGDNKSLQIGEKRSWQAIERMVNPHMLVPEGLRGLVDNGFIPGDHTFVDERDPGKSVRAAFVSDPAMIQPLEEKQQQVRRRIQECFHYPTFSTFDSIPDKTRTATEIMERKGEKLLKLVGPYTNITRSGLRPMIDRMFNICARRGILPPPPPDLEGHPIDYKFNGVLAQAQKLNRVQPNQAIVSFVGDLVSVTKNMAVARKLNVNQAIDVIATNLGCDPSIIRSDDEVAAIEQAEAQAAQQQQMLNTMQQGSEIAKNLAGSPLDEKNALAALTGAR